MPKNLLIYEFAGLRFSLFESILENTQTGKKLKLTQTYGHFLHALVLKAPEVVEYDELRQRVWVQYPEMSESLKHLIQETKRGLVKTLKHEKFPFDFIEAAAGKGYRLTTGVKTVSENESPENLSRDAGDALDFRIAAARVENSCAGFKTISALFYGLLFWLALLLETAYDFDRYGTGAVRLGFPLVIWNAAVMFAALTSVQKPAGKIGAPRFGAGAGLLICGAALSCLAMSSFLPFEPLTQARFQTQPAFAAFLKNVLIYFLPLGIFCVFAPFYLVRSARRQRLAEVLPHLFGLLFLALVYSIFSTFYLLDNLLPSPFHGLFVTLVFLRFIIYFGLGAGCLLWAKTESETDLESVFSRRQWKTATAFGLLAVGLGLFMASSRNYKTPHLDTVKIKILPDANRRLFIDLDGAYFEPETVCVRVIGADCAAAAPCLVPNGALKKHSALAENRLENVPLTLPGGEFQIFVQNGDSPMSNPIALNVP